MEDDDIKRQSAAMFADLLSDFNDIEGTSARQPLNIPQNSGYPDIDRIDQFIQGTQNWPTEEKPLPNSYQPKITKVTFVVKESKLKEIKSISNFSVEIKETGQAIISDIYLRECAVVVAKYLNEGSSISDVKVLGVISSAIQYTGVINEIRKVSAARHSVLRESRYDKAMEYDKELSDLQSSAYKIKERVMSFLRENGYINK